MVCQDMGSVVTGSVILKCRSLCQNCVACQDRWSLMAVVSQDSFHCITAPLYINSSVSCNVMPKPVVNLFTSWPSPKFTSRQVDRFLHHMEARIDSSTRAYLWYQTVTKWLTTRLVRDLPHDCNVSHQHSL